jgi:prevent-host-death family protein
MKTVSTLTLRRKLGQILDEVAAGERVTVTRGNRPLVVLVPAGEYAAGAAGRRRRLETAAARVAEWRAEYAPKLGRVDPVTLVRKDRDSR